MYHSKYAYTIVSVIKQAKKLEYAKLYIANHEMLDTVLAAEVCLCARDSGLEVLFIKLEKIETVFAIPQVKISHAHKAELFI